MSGLPPGSDVNLLYDREGIVDLDAEVSNGALHLSKPKKQLYCPQIPSSTVDQRRLGSPQRVCAVQGCIQSDTCDPFRDRSLILAGWETVVSASPTSEQKLSGLLLVGFEIAIDCQAGLLGDFELHGRPVFFWRTVARLIA